MKVLLTHEIFPPEIHGGGEVVVLELAKRLKSAGIQIKVVTTGDPKIKSFEGIETVRIPSHRYAMNFYSKFIEKEAKGFDIIQTNNYNAAYPSLKAAKKLGIPCVCLVHGAYGERWKDIRGSIFGRLSASVEKFQIARDFDKFIFLSEYAKQQAVKIGVKKERAVVIGPGIPRNFKSYKTGKKEATVLFVGRIAKQKGIKYLAEAAKMLPHVKFIIVGRVDDEKAPCATNIEYRGFVDDKTLLDLYSRALVFCLPSVGETFGLVLLEAMASGCAIVSTVPLDFEGVHVNPKNPLELKGAIEKLTGNFKLAEKLGRKNRDLARKYDWKIFTKKIIGIYRELLRKPIS